MALGFDDHADDDGENNIVNEKDDVVGRDAASLLQRLQLEEKELSAKRIVSKQILMKGTEAYSYRQRALAEYLSNVSNTLLPYWPRMRCGSIDSIRVPFAEEAAKALGRAVQEERLLFDKQTQQSQLTKQTSSQKKKKNPLTQKYIMATILLAIKGDRTSIPLPFGIVRQRDMARMLERIGKDAKVEDCLIGSELLLLPAPLKEGGEGEEEDGIGNEYYYCATEEEMLDSFPGLVPLT